MGRAGRPGRRGQIYNAYVATGVKELRSLRGVWRLCLCARSKQAKHNQYTSEKSSNHGKDYRQRQRTQTIEN
jgi:hypothetical protein